MEPTASLGERRRATVLEHMQAENAHELDRCIAAFAHPRYEIVATGEIYDGGEAVRRLLLENLAAFPDFRFETGSVREADGAVVVEGRFTGTHRGRWRGLPATGRRLDVPMLIVFEFDGERLVCERTWFDLGTALRQLGVARDPNSTAGRIATVSTTR